MRTYYDEVEAGDYEDSWAKLAPDFRVNGNSITYDYYVDFWDGDDIRVRSAELLRADRDEAVIRVALSWNGSDGRDVYDFTLRRASNGDLLIARQVDA